MINEKTIRIKIAIVQFLLTVLEAFIEKLQKIRETNTKER